MGFTPRQFGVHPQDAFPVPDEHHPDGGGPDGASADEAQREYEDGSDEIKVTEGLARGTPGYEMKLSAASCFEVEIRPDQRLPHPPEDIPGTGLR